MGKSFLLYRMHDALDNSNISYILDITKNDAIESHFYYLINKRADKYNIARINSIYVLLLFLQEKNNDVDTCDFIETSLIVKDIKKAICEGSIISNIKGFNGGIININDTGYKFLLSLLNDDKKNNKKTK